MPSRTSIFSRDLDTNHYYFSIMKVILEINAPFLGMSCCIK